MSILIKGIDLPKDDNYIVLEIEKNGTVEAYSSTFGEVDGDPIAVQIPRPHGRLGDLDILLEESLREGAYNYVDSWQIAEQPTILEAEE